jgi:hypothetical protein
MIALSLEAELATCSLRWFSLVSLLPLEFPVSVNVMLVFISVMFFYQYCMPNPEGNLP